MFPDIYFWPPGHSKAAFSNLMTLPAGQANEIVRVQWK